MDLRAEFIDLTKPNDLLALKKHLSEMADELDILYSTTAPNGNISARQGRICLYNNSGTYSYWINTTGLTVWVEISNQTMWQVDGTETQLKTADEIDMQSKKILNVTDPASAQDVSTKAYTDTKISKTTAGEISVMTEKTTLVDADLFLIEDSAASYAKKKVQRSNVTGNPLKLKSATAISSSNSGDIAISASKIYKVIISITNFSTDDTVSLRFNSDATAGSYSFVGGSDTLVTLGSGNSDNSQHTYISCELLFDTFLVGANNRVRYTGTISSVSTTGVIQQTVISGYWANGSSVTDFEIFSGGATLTGNIYVYEMPLT